MLLGESAFSTFEKVFRGVENLRSVNKFEDKTKSEEKDQSTLEGDSTRSTFIAWTRFSVSTFFSSPISKTLQTIVRKSLSRYIFF